MSALIGAGSSLVSGLVNHFGNKSLANNSYKQNLNMWRMQNWYNSPTAQVARLNAAGLNPALAYGGNGQVVGNSESAPQLDYSGVYNQPLLSPDAAMQGFEAMNMAVNRDLGVSQKELNEAKTISELREGVLKGIDIKYADDTAKAMLAQIRLKNDWLVMDKERINKTIDQIIANRNLTKEQITQLGYVNEFLDRTMEARVAAEQQQPALNVAQIRELNAKVGLYSSQIKLIGEEYKKLFETNKMLPAFLATDLAKGFQEVSLMQANEEKIDAQVSYISKETGIAEKQLKTYFLQLFLDQFHAFRGENIKSNQNFLVGTAALAGSASKIIPLLIP